MNNIIDTMEIKEIKEFNIGKINIARIVTSLNFDNYMYKNVNFYYVYILNDSTETIYSGNTKDINKAKKYKNIETLKIAMKKEFAKYI
jgi:hypothetical protein